MHTVIFTTGVYLSFKGVAYANNSIIQITQIGALTLNDGLQYITDKMPCCETPPNRLGEWYFLMVREFLYKVVLHHFTETEETMEQLA